MHWSAWYISVKICEILTYILKLRLTEVFDAFQLKLVKTLLMFIVQQLSTEDLIFTSTLFSKAFLDWWADGIGAFFAAAHFNNIMQYNQESTVAF